MSHPPYEMGPPDDAYPEPRPSVPDLIAQVQALDKKATPGPWESHGSGINGPERLVARTYYDDNEDDSALIAAYRTATPVLAGVLKDALETLAKIQDWSNPRNIQAEIAAFLVRHEYGLKPEICPRKTERTIRRMSYGAQIVARLKSNGVLRS